MFGEVWAGLEDRNFTEAHLDRLHRACEFERLGWAQEKKAERRGDA